MLPLVISYRIREAETEEMLDVDAVLEIEFRSGRQEVNWNIILTLTAGAAALFACEREQTHNACAVSLKYSCYMFYSVYFILLSLLKGGRWVLANSLDPISCQDFITSSSES